jgi:TPP-dependent pyruvate/acetoin dehydrogenase alpha subunit
MDVLTGNTDLLAVWRAMLRARVFDQQVLELTRAGLVPGAVHPSTGHEMAAAGVLSRRHPDEWVVSYYRCHAHALCAGADPGALLREILGRAGGSCAGKGGSMHLADRSVKLLGASSIVASHLPIAAGVAAGERGSGRAVVTFFGDGALGAGPALETLPIASHLGLPMLLVCEDNDWQDHTPSRAVRSLLPEDVLAGVRIPVRVVEDGDVDTLLAATAEALDRCRSGAGPAALVVRSYLRDFHMQMGAGRPPEYRPPAEVAARTANDPLRTLGERLASSGVDVEGLEARVRDEIARVVEGALAAGDPDPRTATTDVTVADWKVAS